ncbi:MAG: hypothetical protein L3J26_09895 [Candidatus Polarisedimenticolaceae bacterium]|nr:hypothetical protein [Candidatus Polarisedimenticolaceae bacterium]
MAPMRGGVKPQGFARQSLFDHRSALHPAIMSLFIRSKIQKRRQNHE